MAGGYIRADGAAEALRAIHHGKLPCGGERLPVVGEVGGHGALIWVSGVGQVNTLH